MKTSEQKMIDGNLINLTLELTSKQQKTEAEERLLRLLMDGPSPSMTEEDLEKEITKLIAETKVGQTRIMTAVSSPTIKKPKDMIFMTKPPTKCSDDIKVFVVHLHIEPKDGKIPHSENEFKTFIEKRITNSRTIHRPVTIQLVSDDLGNRFFFTFELIALDIDDAKNIVSKLLQIYMPKQYKLQSLRAFKGS